MTTTLYKIIDMSGNELIAEFQSGKPDTVGNIKRYQKAYHKRRYQNDAKFRADQSIARKKYYLKSKDKKKLTKDSVAIATDSIDINIDKLDNLNTKEENDIKIEQS